MRKFLLADPSITAEGGHYLEYAQRVLAAASKLGFRPLLATNEAYDAPENGFETIAVFTHDVWGKESAPQNSAIVRPTDADRAYLRWKISRMGRLWAAADRVDIVANCLRDIGVAPRTLRQLERATRLRVRVAAIAETFQGDGLTQRESTLRALRIALRGSGEGAVQPKALLSLTTSTKAAAGFAAGIAQVIDKFSLSDGDHVFLPTMGWHDLTGLQQFLSRGAHESLPHFHLLFRRNVYDGYEDEWDTQEFAIHPLRTLFARVLATKGADRLRTYTDTDALTSQYARLAAPGLVTVPIPTPAIGARRVSKSQRIRLSYLGDARREKGVEHLPELLQSIERSPRSRLSLSMQWYLPSGQTPVEMIGALEKMHRSRSGRLRISEGYLDSRQYADEIADSDAILILYDRAQYIARSSGIFVEAILAGKPVLATAGTWMSGVVDDLTSRYHDFRLQTALILKRLPLRRAAWQGGGETAGQGAVAAVDAPASGVTTTLDVPSGATHLRLTFRDNPNSRGKLTRIACIALRDDAILSEDSYLLGGENVREYSLIVPVVEDQNLARLKISAAYSPFPKTITDVHATWLAVDGDVARAAGGVMFDPNEGGSSITKAIIKGAKELERDYDDHVRAAAFARDVLAGYHNAEHLIRTIVQSTEFRFPSSDAMSVRGW